MAHGGYGPFPHWALRLGVLNAFRGSQSLVEAFFAEGRDTIRDDDDDDGDFSFFRWEVLFISQHMLRGAAQVRAHGSFKFSRAGSSDMPRLSAS